MGATIKIDLKERGFDVVDLIHFMTGTVAGSFEHST
jgi:hypothetical protein